MKLSLVLIIFRSNSSIAEETAKFCESVLYEKDILSIKLASDFNKNNIEDIKSKLQSDLIRHSVEIEGKQAHINYFDKNESREKKKISRNFKIILCRSNFALIKSKYRFHFEGFDTFIFLHLFFIYIFKT